MVDLPLLLLIYGYYPRYHAFLTRLQTRKRQWGGLRWAFPPLGVKQLHRGLPDYYRLLNLVMPTTSGSIGFKFSCKHFTKVQHKHILAKTPKVLGYEHSAKFLAQYTDSKGRYLPCYQFPKREA